MVSSEEILITMLGRDEVSPMLGKINANVQSSASGMSHAWDDSANGLVDSYMSAISTVSSGLSQLNVGMMSLNSVNHQVMSTLGGVKSASEYVFGTTAKADTNKVLVQGWGDAKVSAEELYDTVDKVTDTSLTSMQDLIPAMNAFRAATSATGTELKESVAENMAQFGAYVLALTGSEALAHTAMSDLSKGIKGRWASLDQYGISEDALKATGKWSGEEDDIKGYMEAVREVSGAVEDLMNTSQGVDALLGKMWSRAGKKIGNEFLPGIKSIKVAFMDLDKEMEGNLSTSILAVSLAIEELSGMAYKFSTLSNGFRDLSRVIIGAGQWLGFFGGQMTAQEELMYYQSLATQQNTQEIDNNTMARYDNVNAMYEQMATMDSLNGITNANTGVMATNELNQMMGGTIGNPKSQVVGDVSGLGLDYYQDLANANPNMKFQPSRKEYDAMIESIEKAPRLSTDPSVRVNQIAELTEYATRENSELRHYANVLNNNPEDLHTVSEILKDYNKQSSELENDIVNVKEAIFKMEVFNEGVDDGKIDAPKWDITPLRNSLEELNRGSEEILNQKEQLFDIAKNKGDVPLADIIDDIRLNNVLDNIDTSKIEVDDEASKTLSQALKQKSKNITERLSNALDSLKNIPSTVGAKAKSIGGALKGIPNRISDAFSSINGDAIKNAFSNLDKKLYDPFRDKSKLEVPDIDIGKKAKPVVKAGEELAEVGATAGAVAPAMTEASAGLSFMGLAEMGLAGAFTTLIVPTLAIAGVIAILIPIIAGLTIEAMFFLKIIQQFFVSLNFGGTDMTESIEGIKQIAIAMGYVALAMGALLAVNVMTTIMMPLMAISSIFGGGLTGALDLAIGAIKQSAEKLKQFGDISIDPSIAEDVGKVADALNSISKAMLSLAGIQLSVGITDFLSWIPNMKGVGEALDSAKQDIIEASKHLQDFAGVTPIDEATAQKIQNVCDTLGSVGDAFSGLQKIRDSQNFDIMGAIGGLFGGVDIGQALEDAKGDIIKASQVLSSFGDEVEPVDESLAENIKNVVNSLSSVSEAITSLQSLRDTFNGANMGGQDFNFNVGGFTLISTKVPSVLEALKETRSTIVTASKGLEAFNSMPDIASLNIPEKLKAFTETLNGIATATEGMTNIRKTTKNQDFTQVLSSILTVRRSIITVSKGLEMFNTMPDIAGLGIPKKLKSFGTTLESVSTATQNMINIKSIGKGQDFGEIANSIRSVRRTIITVSSGLDGMAKDPNFKTIDGSVTNTIKSIGTALNQLKTASSGLTTFPKIDEGVGSKVSKSANSIKEISGYFKQFSGDDKVSQGVINAIKSVSKGTTQLKNGASKLKGFPSYNSTTIGNKVKKGVDSVKKASTELKKLAQSDKVDGVKGIIDNIKSAISSLKNSLSKTESFSSTGKGIGTSLQTGLKQGLSGLNTVVTTAVASAGNSGKAYGYTYGQGIGGRMKSGFQAQFKIADIVRGEMSNVVEAINSGGANAVSAMGSIASQMVEKFKTEAGTQSPGHIARTMGAEMGYTASFVNLHGAGPIQAVGNVARRMVRNFNPNLQDNVDVSAVRSRVNTLRSMNSSSNYGGNMRPVTINIGSGAIQLDARNLTTTESRQIMINAIEGLDMIQSVQVKSPTK